MLINIVSHEEWLTPKGRDEKTTMDWVRHYDRYNAADSNECCTPKMSPQRIYPYCIQANSQLPAICG